MILIIDDEKLIRDALSKRLINDNYKVVCAENGKKGLELIDEILPQIIILDIQMPDMSGVEVLKKIKEKKLKYTEIIIITGQGDLEVAIETIKLGAFSFLKKPISFTELNNEIKKIIEKIKSKKQLDEYIIHLQEETSKLDNANKKLDSLYQSVQREYYLSSKIFSKIMETNQYDCDTVKYHLSSMDQANGDLLLYMPKPSGGLYALLGDFTGHGLSAAIGAIPVSNVFFSMTKQNLPISKILAEINYKLKMTLPTGLFFAACMVELNFKDKTVSIWNGGLPPLLIASKETGLKQKIPSQHVPLGVVNNESLDTRVKIVNFDKNDYIYTYSDGVTESFNAEKEMFGEKRLEKFFQNNYDPENALDKIVETLNNYRGDVGQDDDVSILEIACKPFSSKYLEDDRTLNYKKNLSIGWSVSLKFNFHKIQSTDITSFLMKNIEDDLHVKKHKENIYLILQELVMNAIDYGILQLSPKLKKSIKGFEEYATQRQKKLNALNQGWVKVKIKFIPTDNSNIIKIQVEDSGNGFNYQQKLQELNENMTFGGRGIPLVRSLCKEVSYYENGNLVKAEYEVPL